MVEKLVFGRFWLNSSIFEKLLISYSCISFMKHYALRSFCIKLLCFSKNLIFLDLRFLTKFFFMHHLSSLLMQLFMGHIVSCLHLLKERIFFLHVYPQLSFFLSLVCVFLFSPLPKFSPKLFSPKLFFPKLFVFFLFL